MLSVSEVSAMLSLSGKVEEKSI
jgi:hypothetical protein